MAIDKNILQKLEKSFLKTVFFLQGRFILIFIVLAAVVLSSACFIFCWYGFMVSGGNEATQAPELTVDRQLFEKVNSRFKADKKLSQEQNQRTIPDPFR